MRANRVEIAIVPMGLESQGLREMCLREGSYASNGTWAHRDTNAARESSVEHQDGRAQACQLQLVSWFFQYSLLWILPLKSAPLCRAEDCSGTPQGASPLTLWGACSGDGARAEWRSPEYSVDNAMASWAGDVAAAQDVVVRRMVMCSMWNGKKRESGR